jgi:MFS family permease
VSFGVIDFFRRARSPSSLVAAQGLALPFFIGAHVVLVIDQSIMSIVVEPIKHEFRLSDTQLGLLTGFGFSLFFGLVIVPLGRMVDRVNRKRMLVGAIVLFSLMTSAVVATTSFVQLLVTRLLVGAGEAAAKPIMMSMMSDIYPPRRRSGAMAAFFSGQPIGQILAFLLGGWTAQRFGWRAVFFVSGLPGLAVALGILGCVREPARRSDSGAAAGVSAPGFGQTLKFILAQRSLRHLLLTPAIGIIASSGIVVFSSSLFIRSFGRSVSEAGFLLAFLWGIPGAAGTLAAGRIVDRLRRRDERWGAWWCALVYGVAVVAVLLIAFAPSLPWAAAGLALMSLTTTSVYGPATALVQSLVGPRTRGTLAAIYFMGGTLIGVGFGPFVVGALSDAFATSKGPNALRYAIGFLPVFYVWAAAHFLLAARTLRADLRIAATAA